MERVLGLSVAGMSYVCGCFGFCFSGGELLLQVPVWRGRHRGCGAIPRWRMQPPSPVGLLCCSSRIAAVVEY